MSAPRPWEEDQKWFEDLHRVYLSAQGPDVKAWHRLGPLEAD